MNILQYWPQLLSGVVITIELMLSALVLGLFLAALLTALSESGFSFLEAPVNVFFFYYSWNAIARSDFYYLLWQRSVSLVAGNHFVVRAKTTFWLCRYRFGY